MFEIKKPALLSLVLLLTLASSASFACTAKPTQIPGPTPQTKPITVQYLAHSSFLITSSTGLKIIMDPYNVTASMNYAPIDETANIVTVSHEHSDHNNVAAVKGNPEAVRAVGNSDIKGIEFRSIATWHDSVQGSQRGQNRVVCFTLDGVNFCHLGDLGHRLSPEQLTEIGKVDVLFVPVGGNFTIDAKTATTVCDDLKPKIIIPMHYKTAKAGQNFATVDDFLAGKRNVKKLSASTIEIRPGELPSNPEIVTLEPSK